MNLLLTVNINKCKSVNRSKAEILKRSLDFCARVKTVEKMIREKSMDGRNTETIPEYLKSFVRIIAVDK